MMPKLETEGLRQIRKAVAAVQTKLIPGLARDLKVIKPEARKSAGAVLDRRSRKRRAVKTGL